jgi:DNA-directed RNA polymerase specialized sigma24 family protein
MRTENPGVLQTNENLPQLYRFCFLMTGDGAKAQEAFQSTLREGALRAAHGEPPRDRLWFFRDARWRCLELAEQGLQPEPGTIEEEDLSPSAPAQIAQLRPEQLAVWIAGAPDPQRSALAAFFLDEFTPRELQLLLDLKATELSELISTGRRQFQAWMHVTTPHWDAEAHDAAEA